MISKTISIKDFDWAMLSLVGAISALGVMQIYSTTIHTKFAGAHIRQIYWIVGGIAGMFLVSLVNYQLLLDRAHWFYIAAIASLMTVRPRRQLQLDHCKDSNMGVQDVCCCYILLLTLLAPRYTTERF